MRHSAIGRMVSPGVVLAVLISVVGFTITWPAAAGATDLPPGSTATTSPAAPLAPRVPTVPDAGDLFDDPLGPVDDVVEVVEDLLAPAPEPTTEPAAADPEGDPVEDDDPQPAPREPSRPPPPADDEPAPATHEAAAAQVALRSDAAPAAPTRRPLVDALVPTAPSTDAGAPTTFAVGRLNDGSTPERGEYLLAALPGYEMYASPPGPRSSVDILERLRQAGLLPTQIARLLAPFPVAGAANFSDDWGAPRHVPTFHPHAGTDIFAARGTPVIASFDGVIANVGRDTAIGGNSLRLVTPDGTFLYYAHLDSFAPKVVEGTEVAQGQVIGFVGDSGNAAGTPPHLHFEIHPGGGGPIPPVPYLDRWLSDARTAAEQYVAITLTPLAPIVAPPAVLLGEGSAGGTSGVPATGPQAALPLPEQQPGRTAAASDAASPLALLILLGVTALFVLMFRGTRQPRHPATVAPGSAHGPSVPLTLPDPLPLGVADPVASFAGAFEPLSLDGVVAEEPERDRELSLTR